VMLSQLGFIGLGAMGSRMAANLQKISQERLLAEFPLHFRTRRDARVSNAYLISSANS